jgi:peptidoglycan-associated lipoprotein
MNSTTISSITGILVSVLAAACGHAALQPPAAAETASAARVDRGSGSRAVSPNVSVDEAIYALCHLEAHSAVAAAPKFAYDASQLTPADDAVLGKIATCLTTGALAGRAVSLTGRADPRGTEEYNMALGEHRAHSVTSYLEHRGVAAKRIRETSRGALDATGDDESGYRLDRRVDIAVRSSS